METISRFFKLVNKAFKWALIRPVQRFNVADRSKKYLGPDARHFMPAPRAIGSLSQGDGKPIQYPHLVGGFKSLQQKRIEALAAASIASKASSPSDQKAWGRSFSETEQDDNLIIKTSNRLDVNKTIIRIESSDKNTKKLAAGDQHNSNLTSNDDAHHNKSSRPLPKSTNLQLQNPAVIWEVDHTPPGRINLNMLQEIMLNKLADDQHWTPEAIAEKYDIKAEYAEKLVTYVKQIRIVVSPSVAKNLDYVGRNNPSYQAAKHLVYYVDSNLRTEKDKIYDKTFSPETEQLDENVRKVLLGDDDHGPYLTGPEPEPEQELLPNPKPDIKRLP